MQHSSFINPFLFRRRLPGAHPSHPAERDEPSLPHRIHCLEKAHRDLRRSPNLPCMEMRKKEDLRLLVAEIKPKFKAIFKVPRSCVGKPFAKRLKRFRRISKFDTNYKELQEKRAQNPGQKFKDAECLKWTWAPFEEMEN
ncbi:MAG: hypothetical protein GY774_37805 [Planctomycetes bacterium]|nr:hypothetical protein [Planctomycetota bacterium]